MKDVWQMELLSRKFIIYAEMDVSNVMIALIAIHVKRILSCKIQHIAKESAMIIAKYAIIE